MVVTRIARVTERVSQSRQRRRRSMFVHGGQLNVSGSERGIQERLSFLESVAMDSLSPDRSRHCPAAIGQSLPRGTQAAARRSTYTGRRRP